jgi:nucleoside-diphosphate-sugar epimerase
MGNLSLTEKERNLIDMDYVTRKVTELVGDALANSIVTIYRDVTVDIPVQMNDIVNHVAEATGKPVEEIFTRLCSINMRNEIEKMKEALGHSKTEPQPSIQDMLKELGSQTKSPASGDLEGMLDKMKEVEGVFSQFSQLSKTLETLQKTMEVQKNEDEKEPSD